MPRFTIELHGSSLRTPINVEMINRFGGKLDRAVAVPEAQLQEAAYSAIYKINIDSDGQLAITTANR